MKEKDERNKVDRKKKVKERKINERKKEPKKERNKESEISNDITQNTTRIKKKRRTWSSIVRTDQKNCSKMFPLKVF